MNGLKNIYILISLNLLLLGTIGYAQVKAKKENKTTVKWTTDPFDHQLFILNNGQFDGNIPDNKKILYAAQVGLIWVYFTANEVIYNYTEQEKIKDIDNEKDNELVPPATYYLTANWVGANPSVNIKAADELNYYYTYSKGDKQTIKTNIFRTLTYENIYPGIDIEYSFIKGKEGIKYCIIAHPGADISVIQLNYKGADKLKLDSNGNILFRSKLGDFTDHAPISHYSGESANIAVSYIVKENSESFRVNTAYNKSKTLVIDPWTTNPLFSIYDRAYDLDWDYQGNVYAYGGYDNPFQLVKIDNTGAIQWTFNANYFSQNGFNCYGDVATDKSMGTTYLVQGCCDGKAIRLNSGGTVDNTYPGVSNRYELWRAEYDACNNEVVMAMGRDTAEAAILDSGLTTLQPVNVLASHQQYDMSLLALDPNGTQCYMATCKMAGGTFNNEVMQLPMPSFFPPTYLAHEHTHFIELQNEQYEWGAGNAINGAAASPNWLYLYNSDTVRRYNKATGALVSEFPVRLHSAFKWGGIDVDACDNLFVGVADSIYILNSSYAVDTKLKLADTVYDVQLGRGNALYACGNGFVSQLINPLPPMVTAVNTTKSCSCNGSASVTINCAAGNFSYLWSDANSQTTATATGLCSGITYTVTVTDSSICPPRIDTASITIQSGLPVTIDTVSPSCTVSGSASANVTGGNSPYTYLWSNAGTTSSITGLTGGNYYLLVTDSMGCKDSVSFSLTTPAYPKVSVTPLIDTICRGTSVVFNASGNVSYSWAPPTGLTCTNCSNPTASPTVDVTYTLTGDSSGCNTYVPVTIKVASPPQPVISGNDSICKGLTDILNASGGSVYKWNNGQTGSTYTTGAINADSSIEVVAYNFLGTIQCSDTAHFSISIKNAPVVTIVPPAPACKDSSIIIQANATGTGTLTYAWTPGGKTTATITAIDTTATYQVKVTNSCGTTTKSVTITPDIPNLSACCDKAILMGDDTVLTASGNSIVKYQWQPSTGVSCDSCASTTVSPTVTTTYTVMGTDAAGCQTERVITVTVETPCANFTVPNVFTPGNAGPYGKNNVLYIKTSHVDSWDITIYDRWGKEVFKSSNPTQYWDGNTEGGGQAPDGVYYFIIEATCQGNTYKKDGFVQLIM